MDIVAEAPTRVSLFGGGTDLPAFAREYGGITISLAINLKQRARLSTEESIFKHPGSNSNFYNEILAGMNCSIPGLEASFDGIIESGLGSSASAAVALIGAINKLKNLKMTKTQIAEKAWDIEVNKLGLFGGKQDQYAAVFGGINVMEFGKTVTVNPLAYNFLDPILPSLVLMYSGANRSSTKIQEGLKTPNQAQIKNLARIKMIAHEAVEPLVQGDYKTVGELLKKTWEVKKASNNGINNPQIDRLFDEAYQLGAYGGKILGSGGGGFMIFIVDPAKRQDFVKNMGLQEWDFEIDHNGLTTRRLP